MEKEKNNHVWGFDIGKGSLGEAVRIGGDFKHIASVLLDPEFGEIKTAALARRQMRTRKAHKAREKWLEECLEGTGVEILKRREVGIVDGQWQLISKGDERLERVGPQRGHQQRKVATVRKADRNRPAQPEGVQRIQRVGGKLLGGHRQSSPA